MFERLQNLTVKSINAASGLLREQVSSVRVTADEAAGDWMCAFSAAMDRSSDQAAGAQEQSKSGTANASGPVTPDRSAADTAAMPATEDSQTSRNPSDGPTGAAQAESGSPEGTGTDADSADAAPDDLKAGTDAAAGTGTMTTDGLNIALMGLVLPLAKSGQADVSAGAQGLPAAGSAVPGASVSGAGVAGKPVLPMLGIPVSEFAEPVTDARSLNALLQSAQEQGEIREFSIETVRAQGAGLRDAIESAGAATRRKVMDAMRELVQDVRQTGQDARGELPTLDSMQSAGGAGLDGSETFAALTDRPVISGGESGSFLAPGERNLATGAERNGETSGVSASADLDWMAILDEQTSIARLKDTDLLRLDLTLQDEQRVALEARLSDGVLTVRMAAKPDGSAWIPAEQMEALKASLQAASSEVREVVLDSAADFSSGNRADTSGGYQEGRDRREGGSSTGEQRGGDLSDRSTGRMQGVERDARQSGGVDGGIRNVATEAGRVSLKA